jgi:hypothetical protein
MLLAALHVSAALPLDAAAPACINLALAQAVLALPGPLLRLVWALALGSRTTCREPEFKMTAEGLAQDRALRAVSARERAAAAVDVMGRVEGIFHGVRRGDLRMLLARLVVDREVNLRTNVAEPGRRNELLAAAFGAEPVREALARAAAAHAGVREAAECLLAAKWDTLAGFYDGVRCMDDLAARLPVPPPPDAGPPLCQGAEHDGLVALLAAGLEQVGGDDLAELVAALARAFPLPVRLATEPLLLLLADAAAAVDAPPPAPSSADTAVDCHGSGRDQAAALDGKQIESGFGPTALQGAAAPQAGPMRTWCVWAVRWVRGARAEQWLLAGVVGCGAASLLAMAAMQGMDCGCCPLPPDAPVA